MKKTFFKPEIELICFDETDVLDVSTTKYDVMGDDPYEEHLWSKEG